MFGSQVLEAAIGLFLMFFIVALGASSIVEIISRLFGKRATDLEKAIALPRGRSGHGVPAPGGGYPAWSNNGAIIGARCSL